jgi:AraC-like DNA-binding protein
VETASLVRIGALDPFVAILRAAGAPTRPHLQLAAIPEEILSRPESLITKRQFYRFLDSVARDAGMLDVGLRAGERLSVPHLGAPGVEMRRAPTLLDACRVFAAFIDRFVEGNEIWIEEPGDGSAWLMNRVSGGPAPGKEIADHGAIPMLTSVVRLVTGDQWWPKRIQLQTRSMPEAFAASPYGEAEIEFSAPATGIQFRASLLSLPPRPITIAESGAFPEVFPATTAERVEGILEGHFRIGVPMNLEQISEIVGTAPRTLRRRLAEEGLSFRESLERARFRLAREYLGDPDLKIEAIAHHLGYSGSNNFVRAFRRMSGLTPGEFRRQDPAPR